MHFHGKANKGQEEGETGRVERQRKYTHKHTHTLRTFIIITMIVLIIDDHSLPLQLFLFICSASSASASASTSSSLACSCCLNCIPTRSISEKQTEKNSLASFFLFLLFFKCILRSFRCFSSSAAVAAASSSCSSYSSHCSSSFAASSSSSSSSRLAALETCFSVSVCSSLPLTLGSLPLCCVFSLVVDSLHK